ncbi:sigma-54 dependent transcriptional regulator [Halocynthiibacter sp. C4]|uniref:sigma-54-dependent transcriptional regulator n=1 Tax=Halocynthiibacter sp. C4 TaxID=2992758 RepID=UPI00237A35FA|nr:sigma-54 dependent transcriptional regulator [Halocynthiibacter sp. C4]MDE0589494.1 sigma-54 dependent transcriptional regulator [Halocynthiibacter sp. C4]
MQPPKDTAAVQYSVAIIDDDREMRESLSHLLERAGWVTQSFSKGRDALNLIGRQPPDVILSDVRMPTMSGIEILHEVRQFDGPPVVLISAHGDIPMAVSAMQDGAYTFLEKPFDPRRLLTALTHAAEQNRLAARAARLGERLRNLSGLDRILLGQTPQIQTLREELLDLADIDAPILLQGETGTGKDLVARALHDLSHRADGPFVALSCATLPNDHFEATLFGTSEEPGVLEKTSGGSLFLDEMASCPPEAQAKLLRVLETKEYMRLGSTEVLHADVRLISASNSDLEQAVAEGAFRRDLLYRINTLVVDLPPLRHRKDDLALLFRHFTGECARTYDMQAPDPSQDDLTHLLAHDWPGNVRELRQVAERWVLSSRRGIPSVASALRLDDPDQQTPKSLRAAVAALERQIISQALVAHEGRMDETAEHLGIGRRTLNEKIVKLGLDKDALL